MVKRLFEELNRQMIRAESASIKLPDLKDEETAPERKAREENARTLGRLQTQLERLTKMEMDRAAVRATKSARKPSAVRAELARKFASAAQSGPAGGVSGKPE